MEIQDTLVQFISENGDCCKPLFYERTLTDHLEMMRKPATWGTQVELQASTNFYKTYLPTHQKRAERQV